MKVSPGAKRNSARNSVVRIFCDCTGSTPVLNPSTGGKVGWLQLVHRLRSDDIDIGMKYKLPAASFSSSFMESVVRKPQSSSRSKVTDWRL